MAGTQGIGQQQGPLGPPLAGGASGVTEEEAYPSGAGGGQAASTPSPALRRHHPGANNTGDHPGEDNAHDGQGPRKRQRLEQDDGSSKAPSPRPPKPGNGNASRSGKSSRGSGGSKGGPGSRKTKGPATQPVTGQEPRRSTRNSATSCESPPDPLPLPSICSPVLQP
jgi:hypothetical protein